MKRYNWHLTLIDENDKPHDLGEFVGTWDEVCHEADLRADAREGVAGGILCKVELERRGEARC
jgi:hypothetical protein